MLKQLILAGFGGQGVLSMGQLLAYAGMLEGKEVSWIPSYGAEMRGGTANCSVTISDSPISSPFVTEPDILVVLNRPSLDKFENALKPGGSLFLNASLIDRSVRRKDIRVFYITANDLANIVGESKVANMVILGALLQVEPLVNPLSILESLKKVLPESKHHLLPVNEKALQVGANLMKKNTQVKNMYSA